MTRSILTNLRTFIAIAKEAQASAEASLQSRQRPKPDGAPGLILSPDPEQRSFKDSLIAIVFAGIYLEALLHIEGTARLGTAYNDFWKYEEKLLNLGAAETLVVGARQFRLARNDVIHEKPVALKTQRVAQDEARRAIAFVEQVAAWIEASRPHPNS